MKNKEFNNLEFEKALRDKMDEMASSVDCFDKISKRAFPESNPEVTDSECIVNELENITGKRKRFRFTPIIALAAAVALCIFILPRSEGFMNQFYSSVESSGNKLFRELISEIKTETESCTYTYYDMPLDDYIKYDVLVTPNYKCPFEAKNKDNINVRIFVKLHNNYPTNQIYAVEYEGDYDKGNFIAIADSKAKYTEEDFDGTNFNINNASFSSSDPSNNVFGRNDYDYIDKDGNPIIMAKFSSNYIAEYEGALHEFSSCVLYYHQIADTDDSEYFYDLSIYPQYDDKKLSNDLLSDFANYEDYEQALVEKEKKYDDITAYLTEDNWNNSVYYNGNSAMPDKDYSVFTAADLSVDTGITSSGYDYLSDQLVLGTDLPDSEEFTLRPLYISSDDGTFSGTEILSPQSAAYFDIIIPENDKDITITDADDTVYLKRTVKYFSKENYSSTLETGGKTESSPYAWISTDGNYNAGELAEKRENEENEEKIKIEMEYLQVLIESQAELKEFIANNPDSDVLEEKEKELEDTKELIDNIQEELGLAADDVIIDSSDTRADEDE
jgi:hypothetical protein